VDGFPRSPWGAASKKEAEQAARAARRSPSFDSAESRGKPSRFNTLLKEVAVLGAAGLAKSGYDWYDWYDRRQRQKDDDYDSGERMISQQGGNSRLTGDRYPASPRRAHKGRGT
jgi:hypothetical protein